MSRRKTLSLRISLLGAFRSAAQTRDAARVMDLRDQDGERVLAVRRSTGRTGISEAQLRNEVSHDLGMLLNTVNLESSFPLNPHEAVKRSILNYGIPDIAHRSIDEIGVDNIVQEIEEALAHFEPRLARNTIHVTRDKTLEAHDLKVRFMVKGDLLSDPVNVPIEFFAEVQVDTGKIIVSRL